MKLRAATRGSELARWQTDHVAALLRAADPAVEVEAVIVDTTADRRLDLPIWAIGGKGVFVKEVEAAVLDGRADIAVHSAKDLPSTVHPGLFLAAFPERADPRDALVGSTLVDLPTAARVATGSVRRRAQLADLRPDLTFAGLRGNIGTRLAKAAGFDAIVVAAAALDRLGLADRIAERLDVAVIVPQAGQGALAVECRDDAPTALRDLLGAIDHRDTRRTVDAERAFLAELEGDCDVPAGAHALMNGDTPVGITLESVLASPDGHVVLRGRTVGSDPHALGRAAARDLLDRAGGRALLT